MLRGTWHASTKHAHRLIVYWTDHLLRGWRGRNWVDRWTNWACPSRLLCYTVIIIYFSFSCFVFGPAFGERGRGRGNWRGWYYYRRWGNWYGYRRWVWFVISVTLEITKIIIHNYKLYIDWLCHVTSILCIDWSQISCDIKF